MEWKGKFGKPKKITGKDSHKLLLYESKKYDKTVFAFGLKKRINDELLAHLMISSKKKIQKNQMILKFQ